ncbi:MAG: cupin domain-containing protein [Lachnospiraceae bacterium]|nr:cupin domain-containing protein [Lachnospiraceae bacterium]
MFISNSDAVSTPCEPGVTRKILSYNDQIMMCEITFETGACGNFHSHPHVQVTYIISGSFSFTIDGETRTVHAGDSLLMPSGSVHGCECLEAGKLCDVFSPMRSDFLSSN